MHKNVPDPPSCIALGGSYVRKASDQDTSGDTGRRAAVSPFRPGGTRQPLNRITILFRSFQQIGRCNLRLGIFLQLGGQEIRNFKNRAILQRPNVVLERSQLSRLKQ